MRKFSLALFALTAALAIAPAAFADSYNFNYIGNVSNYSSGENYPGDTITLNGVFTTSGAPDSDGGVDITSFTGIYSDSEDGVSGEISLYPGNSTYENHLTSADNCGGMTISSIRTQTRQALRAASLITMVYSLILACPATPMNGK